MAYLSRGSRKEDLQIVAIELGVEDAENLKLSELKKAILEVKDYDEDFVKGFLSSVIEDRKKKEEKEKEEREEERKRREEEREEKRREEEREEKRREEEREEKRREEEREEKRREEEREEKRRQEEREEKIRQEEREERIAREAKAHELEMKKLELSQKFPEQRNESKVEITPKIQLAQIVPKFDEKRDEMGLFLINFERRAEMAEVPKKDWVAYLLAVLPVEIANMLAREPPEDAVNYDFVKTLILKRYKLNSEKLKQCFYRHQKTSEKSWRNYTQELISYFTEWITELNINTFQQLKDLIITEQLKFRVPAEIREHFLESWLTFTTPLELAEKLDDYESITDSFKRKEFPKKNFSNSRNQGWNNYSLDSKRYTRDSKPKFEPKTEASVGLQRDKKEFHTKYSCFACGKEGHLKKSCPKLNTVGQSGGKSSKTDLEKKGLNAICLNMNIPVEEADGRLLKVNLGIGNQKFQGIIDSGAEITVLRESVVPEEYLQSCGKVFLRPAIGSPVEAKLVSVPLTLRTEDEVIPYVRVQVAVVEGLHEEALITPKVFDLLKEQQKLYLGDEVDITPVEETKEKTVFNVEGRCPEEKLETNLNKEEDSEVSDLELIPTPVEEIVLPEKACNEDQEESSSVSQAQMLKKEQLACSTLRKCFEDAKRQKNNYSVESGLLYHKGEVGGQKYVQLVPACRRQGVLILPQETPTVGHLTAKKTRNRNTILFWWEEMPKEVKQISPFLLLRELLLFQGISIKGEDSEFTISKVPVWLRKICNQMLTDISLHGHGITPFEQVVLDKAYDVGVKRGKVDVVRHIEDESSDLHINCHAILGILSELKNKNLDKSFILLALKVFCFYHNEVLKDPGDPKHERFRNLLLAFVQEFMKLDFDVREVLMSNVYEVIEILVTVLDTIFRWDDEDYDKTLMIVLIMLNILMFGTVELSQSDWPVLKICLPSLEKLMKKPINSCLKDMVSCYVTYMAIHSAAGDSSSHEEIMQTCVSKIYKLNNETLRKEDIKSSETPEMDFNHENADQESSFRANSIFMDNPMSAINFPQSSDKTRSLESDLEEMLKFNRDLNKRLDEFTSFESDIQDIKDTSTPIKGYGLTAVGKLLNSRDTVTLYYKKELLSICQENIENDDSYVYLSAVQRLSLLADIDDELVLPNILNIKENPSDKNCKFILKTGEVLLKICRSLEERAYKYKNQLLHTYFIGAKHEDPRISSSNLSNLVEACMYLKFNLSSHWLKEILTWVHSSMKTDRDLEARSYAVIWALGRFEIWTYGIT